MNTDTMFNCGDEKEDMKQLLDCAYDIMELWNPKENELYNLALKTSWLKRARELGAIPSL